MSELRTERGIVEPLCKLFGEVLSRNAFEPEENFFNEGGDSLGVADLILQIEDELGAQLEDIVVLENPSPIALASYILQESGDMEKILGSLPDEEVELLMRHLGI